MGLTGMPVRRALAWITMVSAGSALFLTCAAFVTHDVLAIRATMVRNLSIQAEIVARQSITAIFFRDPESATATLRALQADRHVTAAGIYTTDGHVFAAYTRGGSADAPVPPLEGPPPDGHVFRAQRLELRRGIEFDGSRIGTVVVESDLGELWERLQRYGLIALGVLGASFVLASWTASRLQRVITGPVLHLAETAQAISTRQDYSVRAVAQGSGEIALLVRTFNQMLDQIQQQDAALRRAQEDLERQVDARTMDLQAEVTERKALAEELRRKNKELEEQSRRVQEATRLKSEFLANMSHELRTPLNAIIGFAELLHDGRVGAVSADQRECLSDILTSSRHLLQLINDVLDLSKVEAGKMEFRPEAVDPASLAGEVRDILRGMSARKRMVVESKFDSDLGEVVVDPGKLKQVLYNYLSNALKFTPEGGRVTLRVLREGADHFRVEVEDTGIGIRDEDLPRLFVEFQQLDASAAKAHPGTGLGLALTKRIVEAQGGRVGVRSRPGQGSVFHAVLPRDMPRRDVDEARPPRPTPSPGAPSILVVEDDSQERAWLVGTLSSLGYAVEVAATGREALALCRERTFGGITLDILLSDMSGWDVLKEIRVRSANANTPVIVVTVVAEKGIGAGYAVHDYLVKPVAPEQLLGSLRRAGILPAGEQPILLVDDDAQARKLMETTLHGLGYRTISSTGGAEGLRVAGAESVAAVVLDLLMPDLDGFEFLERFKSTPAGRATPVIVWTAKDLTSDDYSRLAASAQAVVLKREGGAGPLLEEIRLHVPLPAATASSEGNSPA